MYIDAAGRSAQQDMPRTVLRLQEGEWYKMVEFLHQGRWYCSLVDDEASGHERPHVGLFLRIKQILGGF